MSSCSGIEDLRFDSETSGYLEFTRSYNSSPTRVWSCTNLGDRVCPNPSAYLKIFFSAIPPLCLISFLKAFVNFD